MSSRLDGLVRSRCQRNGCTAEILLGHSRHGTPVVLDVRSERRGVLQKVVLEDPRTGEAMGIGRRIEFHDTYTPHRYTCTSRDPEPTEDQAVERRREFGTHISNLEVEDTQASQKEPSAP